MKVGEKMVKELVEKNEICKAPAVSDEIKRLARFWCSRYEVWHDISELIILITETGSVNPWPVGQCWFW